MGDDIKGEFYNDELQPIDENRYLFERIMRKRKSPKGGQESFVKGKRWPTKFNSWVNEEDSDYIQKWEDESKLGVQAYIAQ